MNYNKDEIKDLIDDYLRKEGDDFLSPKLEVYELNLSHFFLYNETLFNDFINNPDIVIEIIKKAIAEYREDGKEIPILLTGVYPLDQKRSIFGEGEKIKEDDVNKIIVMEGQLITVAKEKRPRIRVAAYECSDCGTLNYVMQDIKSKKLKQPDVCSGCGKSRGTVKFILRLEHSTVEEVLTFKIREMGNENFSAMRCIITDSRRINNVNLRIGEVYKIIGILRYYNDERRNDGYYYLEVLGLKPTQGEEISISEDDKKRIEEMSKRKDIITLLKSFIAPDIRGMDKIKESLLLQLVGGEDAYTRDGVLVSGNIHILLIGDPGTAKTQLMYSISKLAPKSVMAIGTSSSTVGLTVSAVKDEFTGEWEYVAGIFPRANNGIAIVDEVDTFLKKEGDGAFLQALESQEITKAVAGAYITMAARISFLGGANPKYGKFDKAQDLLEQVDITPRLYSRMDLIWGIIDENNEDKDREIARALLTMKDEKIDLSFFKKYIAYAKNQHVRMSKEAIKVLEDYYVEIRKKNFYITPRQVRSIKKMAQAYAKLRLKEEVEQEDAEMAINLFNAYLASWGYDAGQFNVGVKSDELEIRKNIYLYLSQVDDAPDIEIINEVADITGQENDKIEEILNKMVKDGEIKKYGDLYSLKK